MLDKQDKLNKLNACRLSVLQCLLHKLLIRYFPWIAAHLIHKGQRKLRKIHHNHSLKITEKHLEGQSEPRPRHAAD